MMTEIAKYEKFEHELSNLSLDDLQTTNNVITEKGQNEKSPLSSSYNVNEQNAQNLQKNPENTTNSINFIENDPKNTSSKTSLTKSINDDDELHRTTDFLSYDPEEHELEDELGFVDPSDPPLRGLNYKYLKWRTRRVVEHFLFRLLTAILILIDAILLIVDLAITFSVESGIEIVSLAFSVYFVFEVLIRIFALGWRHYFYKWYNSLDFLIVISSFVMSVLVVVVEEMQSHPGNLIVMLRLVRLVRISRLLWQRRHLASGARQFVSQNKRRYQKDGFDLDLTYVSPRIIATSFPSTGKMSLYRNDIRDVANFLNTTHKDKYRVYNLCSERHYDVTLFLGTVHRIFIDDHNVPSIIEMLQFSSSVKEWLAENKENIVVIHCKGGKGRTGTMVCVMLIDSGVFRDAEHCLGFFGDRRTDKNVGKTFQGVETPSQCRYVEYYEQIVISGNIYPTEPILILYGIKIEGISSIGAGDGSDFRIFIKSREDTTTFEAVLATWRNCKVEKNSEKDEIFIDFLNAPSVKGNTRVMFQTNNRKIPRGYENCPFFYWFHTGFIKDNKLHLERHELDNPHKSKTWKVFRENFCVTTFFREIENDDQARLI